MHSRHEKDSDREIVVPQHQSQGVLIDDVKVKRIILENTDGSTKFAEGEAAEKLLDEIDSAFLMSQIHGGRGPSVELLAVAGLREIMRFFRQQLWSLVQRKLR